MGKSEGSLSAGQKKRLKKLVKEAKDAMPTGVFTPQESIYMLNVVYNGSPPAHLLAPLQAALQAAQQQQSATTGPVVPAVARSAQQSVPATVSATAQQPATLDDVLPLKSQPHQLAGLLMLPGPKSRAALPAIRTNDEDAHMRDREDSHDIDAGSPMVLDRSDDASNPFVDAQGSTVVDEKLARMQKPLPPPKKPADPTSPVPAEVNQDDAADVELLAAFNDQLDNADILTMTRDELVNQMAQVFQTYSRDYINSAIIARKLEFRDSSAPQDGYIPMQDYEDEQVGDSDAAPPPKSTAHPAKERTERQQDHDAQYYAHIAGLEGDIEEEDRDNKRDMKAIFPPGWRDNEHLWSGAPIDPKAMVFRNLLGLVGGESARRGNSTRFERDDIDAAEANFVLTREDLLSLYEGNTLTQEVLRGIMMAMWPDYIKSNVTIARHHQAQLMIDKLGPWLGDMNNCKQVVQEVMQDAGGAPWNLIEDTTIATGVVNENNIHWYAYAADKTEHVIDIFDSWVSDDDNAQFYREWENTAHVVAMINVVCNSVEADVSWNGDWALRHYSKPYLQKNLVDCGLHAIRNVEDIVAGRPPLSYHNAAELRLRYANLLCSAQAGQLPDGAPFSWGNPLPFEDSMLQRWAKQAASHAASTTVHSAIAGMASKKAPNAQQGTSAGPGGIGLSLAASGVQEEHMSLKEKHDLALLICNLRGEILANWNPNPPAMPLLVSYRAIARVMLNALGALTARMMTTRFRVVWRHLGGDLTRLRSPGQMNNVFVKVLTALVRDPRSGIEVVPGQSPRLSGPNVVYAMIAGFKIGEFDRTAVTWFGAGAFTHYDELLETFDDIETEPVLVIVAQRHSSFPGGLKSAYNADQHAHAVFTDVLEYWDAVHNKRGALPEEITSADQVQDDLSIMFSAYNYCPPPKSSSCRIFQNNQGTAAPADQTIESILRRINDLADGQDPERRPLVTFIMAGLDSLSTDQRSWPYLKHRYPNLHFRVTIVMLDSRVLAIPDVFKRRGHTQLSEEGQGSRGDFAWAHFDIDSVVRLQEALAADPETLMAYHRRDAASFLHMTREIGDYKAEIMADSKAGIGGMIEEDGAAVEAAVFAIGEELISGVQRNNFRFPTIATEEDMKKQCRLCTAEDTGIFWYRAGQLGEPTADVLCDREDCRAAQANTRVTDDPYQKLAVDRAQRPLSKRTAAIDSVGDADMDDDPEANNDNEIDPDADNSALAALLEGGTAQVPRRSRLMLGKRRGGAARAKVREENVVSANPSVANNAPSAQAQGNNSVAQTSAALDMPSAQAKGKHGGSMAPPQTPAAAKTPSSAGTTGGSRKQARGLDANDEQGPPSKKSKVSNPEVLGSRDLGGAGWNKSCNRCLENRITCNGRRPCQKCISAGLPESDCQWRRKRCAACAKKGNMIVAGCDTQDICQRCAQLGIECIRE